MQKSFARNVQIWTVCAFGILLGCVMIWSGWITSPIGIEVCLAGAFIVLLFLLALSIYTAERDSWKEFLEAATDKDLTPKKTVELILQVGDYRSGQVILERCIRDRIERSGNYAWGLAFWTKLYVKDLSLDWVHWLIQIIHSELGMKLHKELDRVKKFFEEHEGGLANEANQEFLVKLIQRDLAMMLEVCGEDKPYKSILPILAETSVTVRKKIFAEARSKREFPTNAELSPEMITVGILNYSNLLTSLEKEVSTWPVAEPIS